MKSKPPRDQGESRRRERGASPQPVLSRRKLWIFRLVAMLGVPALFFLLIETGLRWGGYGFPTDFTLEQELKGREVRIDNHRFSWQFFPPTIARAADPLVIPAQKPSRTYRIFVLGASAAQGDPDSSFSFSRILEVMLRDRYPGVHFEIHNTAITAINSHVVREIARDCARQEPDLFLVYLGNNEVVGPFGAGTVLTPVTSSLVAIRATIWLGRLRIGQLLKDLVQRLGWRQQAPHTWEGMQMFLQRQVRCGDPRMEQVYDNFSANLTDLRRLARSSGASIIFSNVAVNLRDCAPLSSLHREDLDQTGKAKWQSAFAAAERSTTAQEAISHYLAAEKVDDEYADLHYRLGKLYWQTGDFERAGMRFARALQYDTLRFRADARLNEIIEETAESAKPSNGVHFVDAAAAFAERSEHGIPGREFFFEHVHMNFSGNYLLARLFFEETVALLPDWVGEEERSGEPVLSEAECMTQLLYTPYDEQFSEQDMLNRIELPPFTNRSDNEEQRRYLSSRLDELARPDIPHRSESILEEYRRGIEETPEDWRLRYNFARVLESLDRQEERLAQLTALLDLVPHYPLAWIQRGDALSELRKYREAIASYEKAHELAPERSGVLADIGIAYEKLGDPARARQYFDLAVNGNPADIQLLVKLAQHKAALGKFSEALDYYRQADRMAPETRGEIIDGLAFAYLKLGKLQKAGEYYSRAVELTPDESGAHNNLGNVLLLSGQSEPALDHFRRAVQLSPDRTLFRLNLARAETDVGQLEAARREYETVLRSEPVNHEARLGLSHVLMETSAFDEAIEQLTMALEANPGDPETSSLLGLALARTRRFREAIPRFLEALETQPQNVSTRLNLGNSFLAIGAIGRAIDEYETVLHLDPDNLQAHNNLAYCYLEMEDWGKAARHFERYLQMNPADSRARDQLSIALSKAGRP